jgi:hypothetical protein
MLYVVSCVFHCFSKFLERFVRTVCLEMVLFFMCRLSYNFFFALVLSKHILQVLPQNLWSKRKVVPALWYDRDRNLIREFRHQILRSRLVYPVLLASVEYRNFEWRLFSKNRLDGKLG